MRVASGSTSIPCMLEIPTRSTSPEDLDGDRRVNRLIHRSHPTTAAATFNVPALATDSTLYFSFSYFVDDARFHTVSTSFAADMPYAPLPQIGRPVKPAPAHLTINFE